MAGVLDSKFSPKSVGIEIRTSAIWIIEKKPERRIMTRTYIARCRLDQASRFAATPMRLARESVLAPRYRRLRYGDRPRSFRHHPHSLRHHLQADLSCRNRCFFRPKVHPLDGGLRRGCLALNAEQQFERHYATNTAELVQSEATPVYSLGCYRQVTSPEKSTSQEKTGAKQDQTRRFRHGGADGLDIRREVDGINDGAAGPTDKAGCLWTPVLDDGALAVTGPKSPRSFRVR